MSKKTNCVVSFVQSGIVRLVFETLCLELLFSRRSDNNRLLNNGCSTIIITFWKGSTLVRSLSPINVNNRYMYEGKPCLFIKL